MTEIGDAMQGIVNYLAAFFLSLTGGTITGPTTFQANVTANANVLVNGTLTANGNEKVNGTLTANGNETVNGTLTANGNETVYGDLTANANLVLNQNSLISWPGNPNLILSESPAQSPATGAVLRIAKANGTPAGILLGSNTSPTGGVQIFWNTSNQLQITGGDGTTSVGILKIPQLINVTGIQLNTSDSNNTALTLGSASNGIDIVRRPGIAALSYAVLDTSTNTQPAFLNSGHLSVPKTADYTLSLLDLGVTLTNAGATGTVNYTLPPSPKIGYWANFAAVAPQIMTVTNPSGSIFGPGLIGPTRTLNGALIGNQYASFQVLCFDGTNYIVLITQGTIS